MPPRLPDISADAARRIALAAQGFAEPRPGGRVDRRHIRRLVDRIGLIQIDSVNVLVRAEELPVFARLGPHPRTLLRAMTERHQELFEYWGHAACLLPIRSQPLWRWRMERMRARERPWVDHVERRRPGFVRAVLDEVRDRGPITAGELTDGGKASGSWWGWADGKLVLEWLFAAGEITAAGRRTTFEREYDLTERVLPAEILALPTPHPDDAQRELVRMVTRALGVATLSDIFTYLYLRADTTRRRVGELVDAGELQQVRVEGWRQPAYLAAGARQPREVNARALLAPFDPLVFDRARIERLFGMRYRIELYTPAPKRVYGYYVLPFLLGETLVGRVDLKADRAQRTLLVQAAHGEPGVDRHEMAAALADELRLMAGWLALDDVAVPGRGDLAVPLRAALTGS